MWKFVHWSNYLFICIFFWYIFFCSTIHFKPLMQKEFHSLALWFVFLFFAFLYRTNKIFLFGLMCARLNLSKQQKKYCVACIINALHFKRRRRFINWRVTKMVIIIVMVERKPFRWSRFHSLFLSSSVHLYMCMSLVIHFYCYYHSFRIERKNKLNKMEKKNFISIFCLWFSKTSLAARKPFFL